MNSDVAIVNMSLSRLGQSRISSLTETGIAAQLCNLYYEPTQEELVSSVAYDFKFARERRSLAASSGDNLSSWEYKYVIPTTVLKVLNILDSEDYSDATTEWEREGNFLYTNTSPCYIKYTKKIDNPTFMPQTFVEALYLRVAAKMCIKLTQDQQLYQAIMQEFSVAYSVAQAIDGGNSASAEELETLWRE